MAGSHTGLSPEWDRHPDDPYEELLSHDEDLVRAEFEHLTRTAWPWSYRMAPAAPQPDLVHAAPIHTEPSRRWQRP